MNGPWRIGRLPAETWLALRFNSSLPAKALALSTLEAMWQVDSLLPESPGDGWLLLAICEALGDPLAVSPRLDVRRLAERVRQAIEDGRLYAYRVPPVQVSAPALPAPLAKPLESEPSRRATTWFEVRIVDEEGEPVSDIHVVFSQGGSTAKLRTNRDGRARWNDIEASSSFGSVRVASLAEARQALEGRVCMPGSARSDDGVRVILGEDDLTTSIEVETPTTLVLVRPLVRVRLIGMHFDTNKCFLLGSAMRGLRQIVEIYRSDPSGTLLIVGHTDTTGEPAYNLDLSVERAEAVKAYLKDDVAAWEAWFDAGKPWQKRWGSREINAMIEALPCERSVSGFQAWSNSARGTELEVDGSFGPETRKALVAAYMALDGTTLPPDMNVVIHGCGEYFERDATADEVDDPENRRVELYCFHHTVVPPAPGLKATPGEPQYAEWDKQVTRDIDVETDADEMWIRLHDDSIRPMTDVYYRVRFGDRVHAEGTSEDGWVVVFLPATACLEKVEVAWGTPDASGAFPYHMNVRVDCDAGGERSQTSARLHNLGYLVGSDARYEQAVRDFQRDYDVEEDGLEGGALPPETRARLEAIFDEGCDATRSPMSPATEGALDPAAEPAFDSDGTSSCFA